MVMVFAGGPRMYWPTASRPPSRLGRVTSTVPVRGAIRRQMATAQASKSCSSGEVSADGFQDRLALALAGQLIGL